ncbi:CBL-interacting protein kinase 2-like, partial [Coffea arabica]|uniref:non-specific serine/threonine protein kinase n=1 Tax=Coffea arabica TaxID=13443 RepID=A0ABM4WRK2_COFAR
DVKNKNFGHMAYASNLMDMYRKISKAEYKCPNWVPPEVRRLLSRILDPSPHTRISIAKIMENTWFRKGLDQRDLRASIEDKGKNPLNADIAFDLNECCSGPSTETKLEVPKPTNFNAFDIISLSTGFDLSGLFVRNDQKEEVQFISKTSAPSLISKIEEIARRLKLKVMKKEGGVMKLEQPNDCRNGTVSIDVEIFEITSSFHLVEVRKSSGDALDYLKVLQQNLKPALTEIVWAWQGEQQQ